MITIMIKQLPAVSRQKEKEEQKGRVRLASIVRAWAEQDVSTFANNFWNSSALKRHTI